MRALCPRCSRPVRTCLCPWVAPTSTRTQVLVLQHPLEQHQAKGSARLLQLSLQGCRLEVGEVFDPATLQAWLHAPIGGQPARAVLLYPDAAGPPGAPHACHAGHHVHNAHHSPPQPALATRLVVLDGTWRKSRKMLALNPLLQALPRLALQPDAPSRYLIRKAHRPEQLATLEATCLALAQLDGLNPAPLLAAFEHFMGALARQQPG